MFRFLKNIFMRLRGRGPTLLEINGKLLYCRDENERQAAIAAALKLRPVDETIDFTWHRV